MLVSTPLLERLRTMAAAVSFTLVYRIYAHILLYRCTVLLTVSRRSRLKAGASTTLIVV
jgi:hypothetical protein